MMVIVLDLRLPARIKESAPYIPAVMVLNVPLFLHAAQLDIATKHKAFQLNQGVLELSFLGITANIGSNKCRCLPLSLSLPTLDGLLVFELFLSYAWRF